MRQVRQEHDQTEYLRGLYRTPGMSEQTLERALQYSESCSDEPAPEEPAGKRRPGRPRQNANSSDEPIPQR